VEVPERQEFLSAVIISTVEDNKDMTLVAYTSRNCLSSSPIVTEFPVERDVTFFQRWCHSDEGVA
jgi:hypothetical protein